MSTYYRILFILLFSLIFQTSLLAQEKATQITVEISFKTDDETAFSESEIEEINTTTYNRVEIIGKDIFQNRTNISSVENITIVNFRDSIYYFPVGKGAYGKGSITELKQDALNMKILQVFPDKVRNILNRKAHQVKLLLLPENVIFNAWVDTELFHQFQHEYNVPLYEGILEFNYTYNGVITSYQAVKIEEVDVVEDFYSFPNQSSSGNKNPIWKQDDTEDDPELKKYLSAREGLLQKIQNLEKQHQYSGISPFKNGIAKVQTDIKSFYINSKGETVFEELVEEFHPHQHSEHLGQGFWSHTKIDSLTYYLTKTNSRFRILKENGNPPHSGDFEKIIRERNSNYFGVYKGTKKGLLDTWGNLVVPVQFDEVIPLTPRYFLIQKNGKSGVFDTTKQDFSIPLEYDNVDYCGGCDHIDYVLLKQKEKWGIFSLEGNELLSFEFDHKPGSQRSSGNWITSLTRNSKKLLINLKTKKELDVTDYDHVKPLSQTIIHWEKDNQFGLMNENGQQLLQENYSFILDEIYPANRPYLKVLNNEKPRKISLVDTLGNSILPFGDYETADLLINNFFVAGKNSKKGLLDKNLNPVLPLEYEDVSILVSEKDSKTGQQLDVFSFGEYENEGLFFWPSKKIIPSQFQSVKRIFNHDSTQVYIEVALAQKSSVYTSKKGLYNISGEEIIPVEYDNIQFIEDNFFAIAKDSKYGLVDVRSGKVIETPRFSSISKMDKNLIQLKEKESAKIFDTKSGKYLFPEHTYFAKTNDDSLWMIGDANEVRLYDFENRRFISENFQNRRYEWNFKDQLLIVEKSSKTGVINKSGKLIVPFEYDHIELFDSGEMRLETFKENDLIEFYYSKKDGKFINNKPYLESRYSGIHDGSAKMNSFFLISDVLKNGETTYGLMDVSGNEVVKPVYTDIISLNEETGFVTRIDKSGNYSSSSFFGFGILNKTGKEIIPPILNRIQGENYYLLPDNFPVLSELEGYYFYIAENGEVLPFISSRIIEN